MALYLSKTRAVLVCRLHKNSLYFTNTAKLSFLSHHCKQLRIYPNAVNKYGRLLSKHYTLCWIAPNPSTCNFLSTDSKIVSPEIAEVSNQGLAKVIFTEPVYPSPSADSAVDLSSASVISSNDSLNLSSVTDSSTPDVSSVVDTSLLSTDLSSVAEVIEPSLSSLGLCHWTPVGLIEYWLEFLHVTMGMPWWLSIVTATSIARILLFPVFIKAQQNATRFANYMPRFQVLQQKFAIARRSGNAIEAAKYGQELMYYMKVHNINPMKSMIIPMIQAPVFISFFLGLRAMANLPVESLKTGGIWWFTDLTIADPYYVLPIVASATLYVIIKVGADTGMRADSYKIARYFLQALPVLVFPFCMHFPSAVLVYWCSNNILTLGCVSLIKIERVRQYFGIQKIKLPDLKFAEKKKGFMETVKETYNNQKILSTLEDRSRIDDIRFRKAGTGPIPRTYAYDPTKTQPVKASPKK